MPEYDEVLDLLQLKSERKEGISIAQNRAELTETAADIEQTTAEKSGSSPLVLISTAPTHSEKKQSCIGGTKSKLILLTFVLSLVSLFIANQLLGNHIN